MTRITVFGASLHKVGGHWRALSPWADLRRKMDIDVRYSDKLDWGELALSDIVFMHVPHSAQHVKLAQVAKMAKCKLWIDWDDNLWHVPDWNPARHHYEDSGNEGRLNTLAEMADVVTVATPYLQRTISGKASRVELAPNALDDWFIPKKAQTPQNQKSVLWRGSSSHKMDLASYAVPIAKAHYENLMAIGYNPIVEWRQLNYEYKGKFGFQHYLMTARDLSCGVWIVPLVSDQFNRAKSNIAWQEAMTAGAVVVAPDWPEWNVPGTLRYRNADEFTRAITEACKDPESSCEMAREGLEHLREHYQLSIVNRKRKEILKSLL